MDFNLFLYKVALGSEKTRSPLFIGLIIFSIVMFILSISRIIHAFKNKSYYEVYAKGEVVTSISFLVTTIAFGVICGIYLTSDYNSVFGTLSIISLALWVISVFAYGTIFILRHYYYTGHGSNKTWRDVGMSTVDDVLSDPLVAGIEVVADVVDIVTTIL